MGLRRGGAPIPADLAVTVGAVEGGWSFGQCSFVVSVAASGPVRLQYVMEEPAGPTWLRHLRVRPAQRRKVLRAVLASGVLHGSGLPSWPGTPAGGPASGPGGSVAGVPAAVGAAGWLHAAGGGRSVWTPLPFDRRIGGVPVFDLVAGLVPSKVWRELYEQRQAAWQDWAMRPRPKVSGGDLSETVYDLDEPVPDRDPDAVDRVGLARTRHDDVQVWPQGWPGTHTGGGRGGVW